MCGFRAEGRNITIRSPGTGRRPLPPTQEAWVQKSREGLHPSQGLLGSPHALTCVPLSEKEHLPVVFENWELGHFW